MKYSVPLLKKFISINDTPQNIANNLILKTCEIEEINERKIPESIVIGYVKSCKKHPDADKLSVCQVDCGKKGIYQIICGGVNIAAGLYVPVALPGTIFEKTGITIEKRKMRGVESNGMICSKEELGINEDIDKHFIWGLSQEGLETKGKEVEFDFDDIHNEDLGKPLKEKYPWLESWVMDVDNKSITNRPDLTGHFGVAVELNAIYSSVESSKSKIKSQMISFNKVKEYMSQCTTKHIMEIIENSNKPERVVKGETDGLNAYLLLHLKNITIQQTSFFLRLQTIDLGSNSISNWVDFSNLFMNISGHPIHFFDAEKVDGDIIVRNAKDGEKFIDLFEAEHILKSTDIVIADKKKILALAGVIGGIESGITENTKNILVEIANFDPVAVRKTGIRLGLRTDAELRFEKTINPRYTLFGLILFLDELNYYKKDLGNYEIGGLSCYINSKIKDQSLKHIEVDIKIMEQFIFGKKIKGFDKKAEEILTGLGFTEKNNGKGNEMKSGKTGLKTKGNEVQQDIIKNEMKGSLARQDGKLMLSTPLRRGPDDLHIQEDIYEEVARIYGYEHIENLPLFSKMEYSPYNEYVAIQRKLEDILVRNIGCNQVETYPRVSEKTIKELGGDIEVMYKLQNPVNPKAPYMRTDMCCELLAHTAKNSKFFDEFKIFDIGKTWTKNGKRNEMKSNKAGLTTKWNGVQQSKIEKGKFQVDADKKFASSFINEQMQLGVMLYKKNIGQRDKDPLLEAKQIVNMIARELALGEVVFEKTEIPQFHPKKQANIVLKIKGQGPDGSEGFVAEIGFIGTLHPIILQNNKIGETSGVVYLSLNITKIVGNKKEQSEHIYTYETLQDQIIQRDICFVIDANKDFDELISAVKKVSEVKDIEVFDVYAGKNLGDDKKSVSIKIKIIGDGTMTTEQINDILNKVIKTGEKAGGILRA